MRIRVGGLIASFAVVLAAGTLSAGAAAAEAVGIVVVILANDLGYADVGFHGCKDFPTPNLDALAASGVRFASGYVTHPHCSPSRAALMVERYQHPFGTSTMWRMIRRIPTTRSSGAWTAVPGGPCGPVRKN